MVRLGPVAWSDAHSTGIQKVAGSVLWSGNILSLEIAHFYGHSVPTTKMCTKYWLNA